ncbi:MAG TPA: sigma-70 family RNA polymerase sigma factor [Roseiflexaceae bacterium]|nr:sigma-70 family RNA polymerase sigma factor [Roseiflexaceae bacterium]
MLQQSVLSHHSSIRPASAIARPQPASPPVPPRPASEPAPTQLDLGDLVRRCQIEGGRFMRGLPYDDSYAHELFRRALVERNEPAWEQLYLLYYAMVRKWVTRHSSFSDSGECCEHFVNLAFTKFWQAIPPARFESFTSVATLLRYLYHCAQCAVIDTARRQSRADWLPEEEHDPDWVSPQCLETEAVDRMSHEEFWRSIGSELNGEAERVVIFDFFIQGMKPSAIFASHPDLFEDIGSVYRVKRNVLSRLARRPDLRRLLD